MFVECFENIMELLGNVDCANDKSTFRFIREYDFERLRLSGDSGEED